MAWSNCSLKVSFVFFVFFCDDNGALEVEVIPWVLHVGFLSGHWSTEAVIKVLFPIVFDSILSPELSLSLELVWSEFAWPCWSKLEIPDSVYFQSSFFSALRWPATNKTPRSWWTINVCLLWGLAGTDNIIIIALGLRLGPSKLLHSFDRLHQFLGTSFSLRSKLGLLLHIILSLTLRDLKGKSNRLHILSASHYASCDTNDSNDQE